jgi:hypothetical protein
LSFPSLFAIRTPANSYMKSLLSGRPVAVEGPSLRIQRDSHVDEGVINAPGASTLVSRIGNRWS